MRIFNKFFLTCIHKKKNLNLIFDNEDWHSEIRLTVDTDIPQGRDRAFQGYGEYLHIKLS